jgi:hypothetical protein
MCRAGLARLGCLRRRCRRRHSGGLLPRYPQTCCLRQLRLRGKRSSVQASALRLRLQGLGPLLRWAVARQGTARCPRQACRRPPQAQVP